MQCKNHNGVESSYYCSYCGQPLCLECSREINNKVYCTECLERSIEANKKSSPVLNRFKKSKFLTFVFSFIPGVGHMYLGLINRGLSLLVSFFGLIFIWDLFFSRVLSSDSFIVAVCVIFLAYSIFDALAKASEINSGVDIQDYKGINISKCYAYVTDSIKGRKSSIGYVLVILGSLCIFNIFSDTVDEFFINYINIRLPFTMTDVLISLILIGSGVFFIKKGKENF